MVAWERDPVTRTWDRSSVLCTRKVGRLVTQSSGSRVASESLGDPCKTSVGMNMNDSLCSTEAGYKG